MRIVCEKCSAAYAIDDRLITARGVRAQCPRCRHLQLVTRDGATQPAPAQQPTPTAAAASNPMQAQRGLPQSVPGADSNRPPAMMPSVAPVVPPVATLSARPAQPAAPPPAPPIAKWDVPAPEPSQDATQKIDFGADVPAPPPPASSPPGLAPPGAAAQRAAPIDDALLGPRGADAATMGCQSCGKPLSDAFDQALGICDSCRAKADVAASGNAPPQKPGMDLGLHRSAPSAFDDPLGAVAASAPAPERPRPPPPSQAGFSMGAETGSERGKGRVVVVALVLLLIAAASGAAFVFKDRLLGRSRPHEQEVLPEAVTAILPAWKIANPETTGTAAEHLAAGRRFLSEDRVDAYGRAAEEFQKALILDPKSDDALAGYVQAVALGRGAHLDEAAHEDAQRLISAAERRSKRDPKTVLAHAYLLLTQPQKTNNAEQSRALAEEALGKTKDPDAIAQAHLIIGRSWQSTSSALAIESLTRALELDPNLKPALFERALAHEASGDTAAALKDLQKRLSIDPDHWESSRKLAHLYRDAARLELAREVYRSVLAKNPDHPGARLELAVFQYQAERRLPEALGELRGMAKRLQRYDDREQAELLTHLATAERLAGNEGAALDAATRAAKLAPADGAPWLQLYLLALKREQPGEADKALEALRGKLRDPGLEALLEGRLRMAQGRYDDAVAAFDRAVSADPRRIDARLLAGVAAASAGKAELAYRHLFEAAKWDPARGPRASTSTRFYVQPLPLMRGFEDRILKLASSRADVLPLLYEAVLRYHLGDPTATARLTAQVIDRDTNNALAHSWNAFALLSLKNTQGAKTSGERASILGRQLALGHYALGAALVANGRAEEARRALQEALRLDPALLGAEQKLAELDVGRKDPASARARLVRIISLDPAWLPAKQLLFALEKEKMGEGADPR